MRTRKASTTRSAQKREPFHVQHKCIVTLYLHVRMAFTSEQRVLRLNVMPSTRVCVYYIRISIHVKDCCRDEIEIESESPLASPWSVAFLLFLTGWPRDSLCTCDHAGIRRTDSTEASQPQSAEWGKEERGTSRASNSIVSRHTYLFKKINISTQIVNFFPAETQMIHHEINNG